MDRVITHWRAGGHKASDQDKLPYHILIEADGAVARGAYSISAKAPVQAGKGYAAHTRQKNSYSIGLMCCCMVGAIEQPFHPGDAPMTETPWNVMAEAAAQ